MKAKRAPSIVATTALIDLLVRSQEDTVPPHTFQFLDLSSHYLSILTTSNGSAISLFLLGVERYIMEPKPVGKLLSIKELQNLIPSTDGIVHVDGGIVGPDEKWWIDAEGNAYFDGEMTVMKDVDPTFIQLVSTASASGDMSDRSLWVNSQIFTYRNQSGADVIISLGTTPTPPTIVSAINNVADPGTALTNSESTQATISITPSILGVAIYLSAYWTGTCEAADAGFVPTVRLKRGTSLLASYTNFRVNDATTLDNTFFCGGLFYVDSPNTTSSVTYNLTFQASTALAVNYLLHSSLVAFECFPAIA